MKMTDLLLAELVREACATRRALERIPEGLADWKPHAKSMSMGRLATLVASMPAWIATMVNQEGWELSGYVPPPELNSGRDLAELLDRSVSIAQDALEKTTDVHLMLPWRFVVDGKVVNEMPRYEMILDAVFHHLAHHRGQLTVYLRMNDIPVPAIYGPSADEGGTTGNRE